MRRFILDTVLCTFFIFGIIGLFSSVTYFKVFDLFDPIGDMFSDFELSDLVMSRLRVPPPASDDIVVVNIANSNRDRLAIMIDILEQHDPAVIGVDVTLNTPHPYSKDSLLEVVLSKYDNVVLGSELRLPNLETGLFDTLLLPAPRLAQHADFGFVNLLTNAANQDDVKSCRDFLTRQQVKGLKEMQYAFPVKLAAYKDSVKTQRFLDRGNDIETINYKGNVMDFGRSEFGTRFFALDTLDVYMENFSSDLIKDRVIIMCYMGRYLGDQQIRTDLYYTPLNRHYVGKAEPDMFGGVIHANIVSMILEEDYIDSMSEVAGVFIAILACLIIVFFFKVIYGALPEWYDGITKVVQLFIVIGLSILMIWLFHSFNYKVNLTLTVIIIALAGDSIEVYHGVVKNMFSRKARRKLFKINPRFWKEH